MSGDNNNNVQIVSGYLQADGVRNEIGTQKLLQIIRLHDSSVVEIVQAGGEVDIAQNEQSEGGKERWGLPEGGRICGQSFVVKRSEPPLFELVVLNRINASTQKFFNLPLTVTEVKKAGPEDMGKPGVASVLMFRLLDYNQWWGVVFKNQQHLQEMHSVIKRITNNFTIQSTKDAQQRPWNTNSQKQQDSEELFFDVPKDNKNNHNNSHENNLSLKYIEAGELEKNMVKNNTQVSLDQLKFMLQEKSSSTQKEGQQQQSGDPPRSADDLLSDLIVKTTPRQQQQQQQQQQIQTTHSPISNRTFESESFKNEDSSSQNTKEKDKDFAELLNGWSLQNNNNNINNNINNNNNQTSSNNQYNIVKQSENASRKEERQRIKTAFLRLLEKDSFLDMLLDELKNV